MNILKDFRTSIKISYMKLFFYIFLIFFYADSDFSDPTDPIW